MFPSSPPGSTPDRGKWFRQPVAWLGALIFVASLVGCIATIVLALRNADVPVETTGTKVMKVPSSR